MLRAAPVRSTGAATFSPSPDREQPQFNRDAATIVRRSLEIAAGIDVFTNENIVVEVLPCAT